jgi:hypothetical protein
MLPGQTEDIAKAAKYMIKTLMDTMDMTQSGNKLENTH